jgi:hypothetical protein
MRVWQKTPVFERYKIKIIWVETAKIHCPERLYGKASVSMGLLLIDLDETWSSDGGLCDISRASEGSFAVDHGGNGKTL